MVAADATGYLSANVGIASTPSRNTAGVLETNAGATLTQGKDALGSLDDNVGVVLPPQSAVYIPQIAWGTALKPAVDTTIQPLAAPAVGYMDEGDIT